MDAKLKDLVEQYPNDMELGAKVRELYWENLSRLEKLQKEMDGKFIFESPDGGKTVYQRPFGGDVSQRTLLK
jgi:hypothetical protein